jgi:hypothetical protein
MAGKRDKDKRLQASGLESLVAALKRELEGEPAPDGWYTIAQIANMLEVNAPAAVRLAARKRWECKKFTAPTSDNRRILIKHYWIK